MANQYLLTNSLVQVRLHGCVDGFDLMSVHGNDEFLQLVREHKHVVYNYSEAEKIVFTLDDAKSFAKLAGVESQITPNLIIGVVPQNDEHRKSAEVYQKVANDLGANVVIIDEINDMLKFI